MRCYTFKPDYYLYQKDGVWFKTDDETTNTISAHIFAHKGAELPKMEFIPNWNARGLESEEFVAWRVNKFGEQVVRWYWKVGDHSKKCGKCIPIGDGKCGVKVPAVIEWNKVANSWAIKQMQDKASEAEAKLLDNYRR